MEDVQTTCTDNTKELQESQEEVVDPQVSSRDEERQENILETVHEEISTPDEGELAPGCP